MPAALRLPLPANGLPAGIGCERCLVVLLRFSDDDGKEKLLLPHGRLAGAIKPSVGRLPWTTQSRNDHSGGIRGERISEGHGQILPQKKKYAMQKINLAKRPQCRQSTRMSNAVLTSTNSIEDIMFLALADIESPFFDKTAAKTFATENFALLSENSKFLFFHIFPTTAAKAFPITKPEPRFVTAGFAAAEAASF